MAENVSIFTVKSCKSVAAFIALTLIAISVGFTSARNASAETPDSGQNIEPNRMVLSKGSEKSGGGGSKVTMGNINTVANIKLNIMPLHFDEATMVTIDTFIQLPTGEIALRSTESGISYSSIDPPTLVSMRLREDHFQEWPIHLQSWEIYKDNSKDVGWSVHDFSYGYVNEEVKFIALGDHKLTFHAEMDNIDFHNVAFYNWCSDPAAGYFTDNYHGKVREWVLIVRLERDIRLVGDTQCEEELYRPPHDHVRIIDPLLIAVPAGPQSIFLAGGSYAPMPFVIKYDADTGIVGDGVSVFVIDKSEIDRIRQAASDEYESIMASDPEHLYEYGSAGLAALIESRISEYLSKKSAK